MRKYCLILFTLFYSFLSLAQVSRITPAHIDKIIENGDNDSLYFFERLKFYERAANLADEINYVNGKIEANYSKGICNLNLGNYEEAVKQFQFSKELSEQSDSTKMVAKCNYFLGNVNNKIDKLVPALEYWLTAEKQFQELEDLRFTAIVKNGIGIIYSKLDSLDKSVEYFTEALRIFEEMGLISESSIPIGNLGEHYHKKEQYELSLLYYEKSLKINLDFKHPKGMAVDYANIGWCYRDMGFYDKSLEFTNKALAIAEENQFTKLVADFSKDLSVTYKEMGRFKESINQLERYDTITNSIMSQNVKSRIEELEKEFAAKEKVHIEKTQLQEFELLKEKQRFNNILNIGFVLLAILAGIFAWLFFSRLKAKRQLVEIDLKNKTLESQQLQKELDFKNQDLTNFALDISRKNDFAQKLHDRLEELMKEDPKTIKEKARKLYLMAANHLKINDDFKEFQMNIEKVNQDFFNKLNKNFPDLTTNEKQLCGLIRLKLSTKDIASIKNISPKSVEMGRYRLRKKLKLDPKVEITSFLQDL